MTDAYADLWRELYDPTWQAETWVYEWPNVKSLWVIAVRDWTWDTPLRGEMRATCRIGGLRVGCSVARVRDRGVSRRLRSPVRCSRGPRGRHVLRRQRAEARGEYNQWGHGQTKEHWQQFEKYLGIPRGNPRRWVHRAFYKADRVAEYRQAHAVFSERLRKARAEGGVR